MADFNKAFQLMIANEGGYVNDPDDPGGETYKGIARKIFSKWEGWTKVDMLKKQANFPTNLDADTELQQNVSDFYQVTFWDKMNGDQINNQEVASSIFDFGVNAGIETSASLAQKVVGVDVDGSIGKNTVAKLNIYDPELFVYKFAVFKTNRYREIIKKRPTSSKYFAGWVARAVENL